MPGGDSGALQQTIRLDAFHVSLELLVLTQKRVGAALEEIVVPVLDLVDSIAAAHYTVVLISRYQNATQRFLDMIKI